MKQKVLVLCDKEEAYVRKLSQYISHKEGSPFVVYMCVSVDRLLELKQQLEIDILLYSKEMAIQEDILQNISCKFILQTESVVNEKNEIIKYQSAEDIYMILYHYFVDYFVEEGGKKSCNHTGKMIAFYGPCRKSYQTSFAISVGHILSENHKVLYVNLEGYSGFSALCARDYSKDLSDVLYFFQDSQEKLSYKLQMVIEKIDQLYIIPPLLSPVLLTQVQGKIWMELFGHILESDAYDYLLLDLSDYVLGIWEILRGCDVIYTMKGQDAFSIAKYNQYIQYLELAEEINILQKIREIDVSLIPVIRQPIHTFGDLWIHRDWMTYVENQIRNTLSV